VRSYKKLRWHLRSFELILGNIANRVNRPDVSIKIDSMHTAQPYNCLESRLYITVMGSPPMRTDRAPAALEISGGFFSNKFRVSVSGHIGPRP